MNRFESITKPLMWFMTLLLAALVAGCGNGGGNPNLGGVDVGAITVVSIAVTPATMVSIPVNGTQQYTAIATYSDGSSRDETVSSTWTSVNVPVGGPAVATLSANGATGGLATGASQGTATITATLGLNTATATLTVNAATSVSFAVTPATASIPVSGTQQYTVIETFSDGSIYDRTAASTWTSVNVPAGGPAVATLSADGATGGLATGAVAGNATITATQGLQTASVPLKVTTATVTSIAVTPATASILVNGTQQYTAIAILSDGSSNDVTANVLTTWVSSSPAVASLSPSGAGGGLATGVAVGTSNITAAFGGKTSPLFPAAGGVQLTVTATNFGPAGAAPNLKTVAPFGIIAYDAITNSAGASHIYGDVALTQPGGTIASVTGPGTNDGGVAPLLTSSMVTDSYSVPPTPGLITAADNGDPAKIAALPQLLVDLRAVYDDLMLRAAPVTPLTTIASAAGVPGGTFAAATDLSGYVLSPGIYTSPATYGLSNTLGPLVLDAGGNPDAVFIIRSTQSGPSGLTSTTGSVVLQNGAQAKNVFWVVDNLTVGGGTFFQGTVVAGHAITLLGYANVEGRMMAGALGLVSGAITLTSTNIITVPK